MKHRIKLWLREAWARLLFHTGLHALVDRLMPPRMTVLAGHCVDDPAVNDYFPRDMKIRREKLGAILAWLQRRYELVTVADGFARMRADGRGAKTRSLVALSMDDGYKDNRTALLPLLQQLGAPATVYLESRPLEERRINWSHKLFWVLHSMPAEDFARRYAELSADAGTAEKLRGALARAERVAYHVKRVLKYDAALEDRERVIDLIFRERGGNERDLCDRIYMKLDDALVLEGAGVELGAHTVNHAILSRLDREAQRREIEGCVSTLERSVGTRPRTFAYPWGRRWDFDDTSAALAREIGFEATVTSHAGTNDARTDPARLRRVCIDEDAQLHLIAAEACGGFDLARRFGLDLSE